MVSHARAVVPGLTSEFDCKVTAGFDGGKVALFAILGRSVCAVGQFYRQDTANDISEADERISAAAVMRSSAAKRQRWVGMCRLTVIMGAADTDKRPLGGTLHGDLRARPVEVLVDHEATFRGRAEFALAARQQPPDADVESSQYRLLREST